MTDETGNTTKPRKRHKPFTDAEIKRYLRLAQAPGASKQKIAETYGFNKTMWSKWGKKFPELYSPSPAPQKGKRRGPYKKNKARANVNGRRPVSKVVTDRQDALKEQLLQSQGSIAWLTNENQRLERENQRLKNKLVNLMLEQED